MEMERWASMGGAGMGGTNVGRRGWAQAADFPGKDGQENMEGPKPEVDYRFTTPQWLIVSKHKIS